MSSATTNPPNLNPQGQPRINRRPTTVQNQIDGRPTRQPFLSHASDDEFVAAYCGYSNIADLNKFRFSETMLHQRMTGRYNILSHFDIATRNLAVVYLLQWVMDNRIEKKVTSFLECFEDEDTPAAPLTPMLAFCLLTTVAGLADMRAEEYNSAESAQGSREGFLTYLKEECGLPGVVRLPVTAEIIEKPVLMVDEEDLEGCLRLLLVLESVSLLTERGAWVRRFPGTMG